MKCNLALLMMALAATAHPVQAGYVFTNVEDPGNVNGTFATGINDTGQVTGYYVDSSGFTHGFVMSPGGVFTNVEDPGNVNGTFATGINDTGQVTGYYVDSSGFTHGFVATSVPEPSSLVLFLIGASPFAALLCRRSARSRLSRMNKAATL